MSRLPSTLKYCMEIAMFMMQTSAARGLRFRVSGLQASASGLRLQLLRLLTHDLKLLKDESGAYWPSSYEGGR